jgi:hypothetical protein
MRASGTSCGSHGGCGLWRTVSSHVVCGIGHLLDQRSAQVLELALELNVFGDGHAVLRDLGPAVRLLNNHIAALRCGRARRRSQRSRTANEFPEAAFRDANAAAWLPSR